MIRLRRRRDEHDEHDEHDELMTQVDQGVAIAGDLFGEVESIGEAAAEIRDELHDTTAELPAAAADLRAAAAALRQTVQRLGQGGGAR